MKITDNIELQRATLGNLLIQFAAIPDKELAEFVNLFSAEFFPKKSVIIAPNTIVSKLYFVVSGLVRIFYEAEGKEITSDFKEENSFFANGYTLFTGIPNIDSYVALEDTICLVADYERIESLTQKYHSIEHLGRKLVEAYYAAFLITNYNKLFLSADERYAVFMKERQDILNRVSLKYVASHLGVTPETLSRMRAKSYTIES